MGVLATLAAWLAGCSTPTPPAPAPDAAAAYQVPAGAPTARLLMRATVPAPDRFVVFALDDALLCKGPKVVGRGGGNQQPAAATLAAGVLTTLDFMVIKPPRQTCLVRWSFTPVAGRTYALQGGVSAGNCGAVVLDATQPDQVKPAEGALRRNPTGQSCLPLDKSAPAPRSMLEGGQVNGEAVLNPAATTADLEGLVRP